MSSSFSSSADGAPRTLDQLFEAQARRTPDAVALVHRDQRLTYRQLHDRALAVAGRLAALGVRRESLVALAFPRGVDAVVGTLGVVLAGGAYLPVNPAFPPERITRMLADAAPPLILCAAPAAGALRDAVPAATRLLTLDELLAAPAPAEPPAPAGDPEADAGSPLAYVMYTSGSTGRPKGVMVEHAGVVRLVRDTDWFTFTAADRCLQTGALEFDAATFEIWGTLLAGATLHLVDQEVLLTPARLKQTLYDAGITVLWLTAPLFNQMVDEDVTMFARLGTLLVGGDVLSCRHVNLVREACPALRVLNGYGPTENTTFTTVFPVERGYRDAVPIGRPIRGTTALVVTPEGRPAAPGRIGELYTGGLGLARGYLHNPELTAERFVHLDGERYYRTGDLVSADADGVLSFHGRTDDQVKIRGHRVEVKEVTHALLEAPGVRDAHTVVAGTGSARHLLGYAVLAAGTEAAEVLDGLRRTLPPYLCPDQVIPLPALPLNANGKVDAARLPAPAARAAAPAGERTPDEQRLARLWAEVLHLGPEAIGPDDDFFASGGNSIAAGALLGRIARTLGATLGFHQLFAARTLRLMAREVAAADRTELAPIPALAPRASYALHPQQRALYAVWQTDPASTAYNIPVRIEVSPSLDADRLRSALAGLLRRHDALRTAFHADGDDVRQLVRDHAEAELDVVTAPLTDAEALARLVRPFDLAAAPLVRALLLPGDGTDRLYLDVHHIVFDGVSLQVLLDELLDLYVGIEPAAPPVRYADAAEWFAEHTAAGSFAESERYWLETFPEPPPALGLATDFPRPPVRSTRGAVLRQELGPARDRALRACAAQHGVTDFTVLMSAYAAALARITGGLDLTIGCPMSGRVHPDLDGVVGMFVNTVPLRLRLEPGDSLADLLRRVADRHHLALTHQSHPFEQLARQVVTVRDHSRNPLFDAFFALQDLGVHHLRRHGLRAAVALPHPGTSRFDLNLQAYRRPEGTVLEFEYGTELFTAQSAGFLLARTVAALDEILADATGPVLPTAPAVEPTAAPAAATFSF
ncbi:non-ribosomal peptide synthetase [Kitasatospora sp. MBT63]|uniref:non-ribosomal peptide synthetase n=1 Tax=Kitasatospora sp. MBT63 TaxID=1444768 RepID=UPI001314789D|nr:non-ribosomal peptide synthetase [Kitasatospora sp. MBT63]